MLSFYDIQHKREEVKLWYDGYIFGKYENKKVNALAFTFGKDCKAILVGVQLLFVNGVISYKIKKVNA